MLSCKNPFLSKYFFQVNSADYIDGALLYTNRKLKTTVSNAKNKILPNITASIYLTIPVYPCDTGKHEKTADNKTKTDSTAAGT